MSIRYTAQDPNPHAPFVYRGPRGTGWTYSAVTTAGGRAEVIADRDTTRWVMRVRSLQTAASIVTALTDGRIDAHSFQWQARQEGDTNV